MTCMDAFDVWNIFLARKYWEGEATREQEQPHSCFCMFSCRTNNSGLYLTWVPFVFQRRTRPIFRFFSNQYDNIKKWDLLLNRESKIQASLLWICSPANNFKMLIKRRKLSMTAALWLMTPVMFYCPQRQASSWLRKMQCGLDWSKHAKSLVWVWLELFYPLNQK